MREHRPLHLLEAIWNTGQARWWLGAMIVIGCGALFGCGAIVDEIQTVIAVSP